MAVERTFSIIKPDATRRNLTGPINALIEQAGLRSGREVERLRSRRRCLAGAVAAGIDHIVRSHHALFAVAFRRLMEIICSVRL